MAVRIIKAKTGPKSESHALRLRVAAYARVSTDSEEQESSYESQCLHYSNYISSNPAWIFAGIYADEGITGTSIKHREQFNRMIEDCKEHKIDMIITKSISRWARNTIDSLQHIRLLKDLGVAVLFEKEAINTMDSKGEAFLTIMSSIAQEESGSISRNVRLGLQYQMQRGKGQLNTSQFLGFTKENGRLTIVPEEADTVRRIFREYLEGHSPAMIAASLSSDNILTPAKKTRWYPSTVASILSNEKYCGDLLLQKYFVPDFLTHKIVRNEGQLPQYFVEDDHDPIVPKDIFFQVQNEMHRRSVTPTRFGSTTSLRGRLICGICGNVLKQYRGRDIGHTDWRCRNRSYEKRSTERTVSGSCPCKIIPEMQIRSIILEAFNLLPEKRDALLLNRTVIRQGDIHRIDDSISDIENWQKRISEKMTADTGNEASTHTDFLRAEVDELEDKRTRLLLERAELVNKEMQIRMLLEVIELLSDASRQTSTNEKEHLDAACSDANDFFKRTGYQPKTGVIRDGRIALFDDGLVFRYLDHVTVYPDRYEVSFKAGLDVTISSAK